MKNAYMPAMPCGIEQDGYHPGQVPAVWGLTKREMFAMHAPSDVPGWYYDIFVSSPEMKDEYLWGTEGDECTPAECDLTDLGKKAIYFSWKAYHAKELLAELDK